MRKLQLPPTVHSTYYKDKHVVKVVFDGCDMPDMCWDILREITKANGMKTNVRKLYDELGDNAPFVFGSFAEFNADVIDLSTVDETFKDVKDERRVKLARKEADS